MLLECVPNFSEGRDVSIINKIAAAIESVQHVKILHTDIGFAANRTVITFAGEADAVIEAAFRAIKIASELVDMTKHTGVHPRIGATDVCPLIPLSGISMAQTVELSVKLARRVGNELNIPVYLYENSASLPHRKNLADIRKDEYEGLQQKMLQPEWQPDFFGGQGSPVDNNFLTSNQNNTPLTLNAGATVIGARDFLIAYNVNLDTQDVSIAKEIAKDVRESGRKRGEERLERRNENLSVNSNLISHNSSFMSKSLSLKSVKAIGWYIPEYQRAQVSMNLTNINITSVHTAFEACKKSAQKYGVRVTGSELIGLIPEKVLLEAGKFYFDVGRRTFDSGKEPDLVFNTQSQTFLIEVAVKHLGLDELKPFYPNERIIEYVLEKKFSSGVLRQLF